MHPVIALVTAGVEMDVLGIAYDDYSEAERETVVQAHPRSAHFKEDIIQAFYDGIKHSRKQRSGRQRRRPGGQGSEFRRINFCTVIRGSAWRS